MNDGHQNISMKAGFRKPFFSLKKAQPTGFYWVLGFLGFFI